MKPKIAIRVKKSIIQINEINYCSSFDFICIRYAIRNIQENQVGLKLNGTYQLLAYVDDVTILGDNIYAIKKNT
jgi:hypothetical protein